MKILFTLLAFQLCLGLNAQQPEPSFQKKGDMVKATYFHENGQVAQTGFFMNGKLHGEWVMFDDQGNKTAMGNYEEGKRTGKWFFWEGKGLKEVDFADNAIANVVKWDNAESVVIKE